ncbi:GNAT family N-acetyltransferase [Leucobacter massiliensis]|uniref:GNAT family N-acetyltransferase n=1 Tax=Leucobacter massiliensis TaxID=1686285 RepID=UPI001FE32205|nr:GNAT family N-acetyltransferase [Leucobacter massiliensis]
MTITAEPRAGLPPAPVYAFAYVRYDDPLGAPLLRDLEREYDSRYGVEVFGEPAAAEINRYPAAAFAEPDGAFLLLLEDGEPVSGGAFFRLDERTAEVKRVWTRADRRGRGLARLVLTELEHEAKRLGYERIYLTTGPRQPEAVALYRGHGYTPLFDVALPAAEIGVHPFEKSLAEIPVQSRRRTVEVAAKAATVPATAETAAPETAAPETAETAPAATAPATRRVGDAPAGTGSYTHLTPADHMQGGRVRGWRGH